MTAQACFDSSALGTVVAPGGWNETVLLVIGAYIDGSNLHQGAPLICVAGCATDVTKWPAWEKKWQELLDFADLPRWDHCAFINKIKKKPGEPDRNWKEAEWLIARRMLCEAFEEVNPTCSATTILRADYDHFHALYDIPDDPYYFLLDRTLHRFIQGMFEPSPDTGVVIYCDQDREEKLVKYLAKWHARHLRERGNSWHPDWASRPVVTAYGSNLDYRPLQAADVVAYETMDFARRNPTMPFLATNMDSGSWVLERLKGKSPWLVMCLWRRLLDAELDGRAYPKDQLPGYGFTPAPRRG